MTTITPARAYATVTGLTATLTHPDGRTESVHPETGVDIRQAVMQRAAAEAYRTGIPVELVTSGDHGRHHLVIDPDGTLTHLPAPASTPAPPAPVSASTETRRRHDSMENTQISGGEVKDRREAPRPDGEEGTEPPTRPTFLTPTTAVAPSPGGWRSVLARVGIHVPASAAQRQRAHHVAVVSRQWAGCRTLAVVNGKGGVGKTMTTAMLAAVYAREGGGNVLAWDNNDTRGTLGWRTEQGLYDTTLRDLLPAAATLLAPGAGVSDITQYVHHQGADRYDVLRSNPELLATDQRIDQAGFDLLMQVAARFYRLVIFDSGNDESAARWLRMIDSSYQLVIPTLPNPESAESAALLLDALRDRDERGAALAQHAVVVVTQPEPGTRAAAARVADGFTGHVRQVLTIPFDPALKAGPLRFEGLRPRTRDAWLAVAAAAAETL
jgi:MinD-like ATPase involved in chromosome partitioning or flagellar assembly